MIQVITVIFRLRQFMVLVMCAGILLPVLSSADDIALLSPVLQGLSRSAAGNQLDKPSVDSGAPDASFWLLFDFLQCPDLFHFAPHMEFAGKVFATALEFPSASAPRPAGRSPPACI
jgi:hypothetical protein